MINPRVQDFDQGMYNGGRGAVEALQLSYEVARVITTADSEIANMTLDDYLSSLPPPARAMAASMPSLPTMYDLSLIHI